MPQISKWGSNCGILIFAFLFFLTCKWTETQRPNRAHWHLLNGTDRLPVRSPPPHPNLTLGLTVLQPNKWGICLQQKRIGMTGGERGGWVAVGDVTRQTDVSLYYPESPLHRLTCVLETKRDIFLRLSQFVWEYVGGDAWYRLYGGSDNSVSVCAAKSQIWRWAANSYATLHYWRKKKMGTLVKQSSH